MRFELTAVSALACLCCLAFGACSAAPDAGLPAGWGGRWSVVRELPAPGETAVDDAQARQVLGRTVELDAGDARFGEEPCPAPSYATTEQSLGDFLLGFRLTPDAFRLAGDRVRTLEVRCRRSVTHTLAALGNGCVILAWEGRFFQLARPPPDGKATVASCLR